MAVTREATVHRYIGLAGDSKPTGVPVGSTYLCHDTDELYITHDGTTWVLKDSLVRMIAGSALIGTVGIDQTTPATTNKVIAGKVLTVYNATGAAAIALSTTMAKAFRLLSVTVHFSAAPTTSEALTIKVNANDGAAYDTLLKSINPSLTAATDIAYSPNHDDGEGVFESGDEIDVAFTNTDLRTYGIRIVCEAL